MLKLKNNKKGILFQGMNYLLFLFFTAIVFSITFVGLPLYSNQKLTAVIEEQNIVIQSKGLFQMLASEKEGVSIAQKILLGDTESLYELLKTVYGEKVQCRLKLDALTRETKCMALITPPDSVALLVPSYDGKIHTISLEGSK